MPFISYTKARHFEWQAERGGEYARGKEGVTNRSPASFLPHPPLKKDVRSEQIKEATYESARVSVKVKL